MKENLKKYITKCTLTFKAFGFEVTMSEGRASLWNFTCFNPHNKKKYAVYCAPELGKVKSLIKIALKKLPPETRLVVVTSQYTEDELDKANSDNYCLVTVDTLQEYGEEMLEIENAVPKKKTDEDDRLKSDQDSVVDDFLDKDGIFKG